MNEKKFRLLKDLPDVKAGVVFCKIFENEGKWYCSESFPSNYTKSRIVENTPEWFKEIKEPDYPKSFDNLNKLSGYYIYSDSFIVLSKYKVCSTPANKNMFFTEKQALSSLAFAQLSQLHNAIINEYNNVNVCDWKPNWISFVKNMTRGGTKYYITRNSDELNVSSSDGVFHHLCFPTYDLAEFSLNHHKELWEQYYEM